MVREHAGGLEIALHVVPRARRTELDGRRGDALKVRVAAPPVEGAANRAVVAFFAELLGLSRSRLSLASGDRSRSKVLRIEGFGIEDLRERLPEAIEPPAR